MQKSKLPDLSYHVEKLYEGINRQDRAELAMVTIPLIKKLMQEHQQEFSGTILDEQGYESIKNSTIRLLNELEEYYNEFNNNETTRLDQTTALKIYNEVRKQTGELERLCTR